MSSGEIFSFLSTSALCLLIGGLLLMSALGWAPRGAGSRVRGGLRSGVSWAPHAPSRFFPECQSLSEGSQENGPMSFYVLYKKYKCRHG